MRATSRRVAWTTTMIASLLAGGCSTFGALPFEEQTREGEMGLRINQPPIARVEPHETTIHGRTLVDDYHWLRERGSADVIAYLEDENRYTRARTRHLGELEERIYEEFLSRLQETDLTVPERDGEFYYYTRTEEGKQYPIYVRKRGSLDAEEELLLDVNALAEEEEYFDLGVVEMSPDHRLLAYSYDTRGAEEFTLVVLDLATDELLEDRIERTTYGVEWGNDNRTLLYTTFDDAKRPDRIWRHRLGADPADDELVYEETDEKFRVWVTKTRDRSYLLISSESATTSEVRFLDAGEPLGAPQLFRAREPGIEYGLDHRDGFFYVHTNEEAKNFKLMRTPVDRLDPAGWEEVIAHRPEVKLEWAPLFAGHMVVVARVDGLRTLTFHDLATGSATPIELPEEVYALWPGRNPEFDTDTFRFTYTSMVTPKTVYDYRVDSDELELLKRDEVLGGYDASRYETRRLWVAARDGTRIPVSLLQRKGMALRHRPMMLYGYGSYGASIDPSFGSTVFSLVDRGFVYAIAHVRGGGELGEPWHDDGKLMRKKNTFTDFVDVAQHFVDEGVTRPDLLAIRGGSAGGLLMGAVVNMRPDLFGCVVAQVPFVDVINTMLDDSIPLTVNEYEEWGDPREPEAFEYILSYSPYDNVTAQDYPPMLITAGLNDPRVQYWEPAKWTAKLRAMRTDDDLLLLKTNMGAGHGGASGRYDALRERAFIWAFVLDQLGFVE